MTTTTLVRTRKVSEAVFAECPKCGMAADGCHPYWSLSKIRGLHLGGCGGSMVLYTWADD